VRGPGRWHQAPLGRVGAVQAKADAVVTSGQSLWTLDPSPLAIEASSPGFGVAFAGSGPALDLAGLSLSRLIAIARRTGVPTLFHTCLQSRATAVVACEMRSLIDGDPD
jgi:hypothetical protein